MRYQNYKGNNIELARQRAARNPWYQYGLGSDSYVTGLMMPYYELADEEDIANQKRMLQLYDPDRADGQVAEYQDLNRRFKEKTVTILIRMILSLVRIPGFTPNLMEILFSMRTAIKIPMYYMYCAANRSFQ